MKPVSGEQLKAYFLGKLPEAEAEDLEMECAASAELTEEAQTVEMELADDYQRGNLSSADARLFETNYLITEARHQRLSVAAGLRRVAGETKSDCAATASPNSVWQAIFDKRHRFQLVCACLFLLIGFGGVSFYLLTLNFTKNDVAEVKDVNQPQKTENPPVKNPDVNDQNLKTGSANSVGSNKEANKNSTLPQKTPSDIKTVSPPKNIEQNVPGLAVFALLPGTLRSEGEQSVTIAPNVKNVKLQLNLPEDANKYRIYRAVLKTADGDEVFTSPNIRSSGLTVSAVKLENRTYIAFLEGQNAQNVFEPLAEYTFRVRR